MNDTTQPLPVILTTTRKLLERTWDYPVERIEFLLPDASDELRRAFATSLALGSEGQPVIVGAGVKDPVTTQFVNVSFRMESCTVQVSGDHKFETISGPNTDGSGNRTELVFIDGEIKLVTLVATNVLTSESGERSE